MNLSTLPSESTAPCERGGGGWRPLRAQKFRGRQVYITSFVACHKKVRAGAKLRLRSERSFLFARPCASTSEFVEIHQLRMVGDGFKNNYAKEMKMTRVKLIINWKLSKFTFICPRFFLAHHSIQRKIESTYKMFGAAI